MNNGRGPVTSPTLLGRLQREPIDQAAWEEFVRRYGPRIYSWCRRWQLAADDAEEVTQEVLVLLSQKLRTFAYEPSGSFRGWLKTVTRHAWSDYLDRRRPPGINGHQTTLPLDALPAAEELADYLREEFDHEMLDEAMARVRLRVEPHTWEAFRLMRLEGQSGAEVARRLHLKPSTVFVIVGRVQKKIQAEVQKLEQAG